MVLEMWQVESETNTTPIFQVNSNGIVECNKVQDVENKVTSNVLENFDLNDNFDPFYGVEEYNEKYANFDMNGDFFDVNKDTNILVSSEGDSMDDESNSDSEFFLDEENLVTEVDVDMRDFNLLVEKEVQSVGIKESDGQVIEVLDNDDFEEAGFEGNNRRKMLKELQKPRECSNGQVHHVSFKLGQTFKEKKEVNNLIKNHALESRRDLHIIKNDKIRVRAICRGHVPVISSSGLATISKGQEKMVLSDEKLCPWVLLISRSNEEEAWMVKTYEKHHTCLQSRNIKACTSALLANKIVDQVEGNPSIPMKALQQQLQKKYEVGLSRMKVYRAKAIAHNQVLGDYEKQYALLRDYLMEIQATNLGTTIKLEVESEHNLSSKTRVFKRIYICLGALKHGFKVGKRDLLGLDGAFMKGPFPGQILSAVGIDSNNGIYPLVYALVEAETTNSWAWFLDCLGDDLDLATNSNFTFITDRQKGVIPAISKAFPNAEHRFCLKHIHENMKLRWREKEYKDLLWKCATSYSLQMFEKAMEELKRLNKDAFEWLSQIPPRHWAISHFSGRAHSNVLLNNMCESFNSKLVDGRNKPIIATLEYIREYLMKRLSNVQQIIDKCEGPLTPYATGLLEKVKKDASQYICQFNGAGKYQVTGPWMDQCVVNFNEKTCTCRRWEVTGIPCKHIVAAIWDMELNGQKVGAPEQLVHPTYWLDTWKEMYKVKIDPINGRGMWPVSQCPTTLLPPKHHKQVGRPKKKRRRTEDEHGGQRSSKGKKLPKIWMTVTCSKCKNKGHNARSCKGQGGDGESSKTVGKRSNDKGKRPGDSTESV